jgi:predicted Zn finger-like uncharacterized protein
MIVICTKCQAKFRVADEKIGARGAKVRCSRCQTVFVVRRDPAAPAPAPAAAPADDPFAAPPPAAPDSFAARPAAADPFAGADPFAAPAPSAPRSALPVTDLSDLLGSAAVPGKPRAVPPPLPPAARGAAALPAPDAAAGPFDPAAGSTPPEPDPFAPAGPAHAPAAAPDDGGLALEDRYTPPPVKVAPPEEQPLALDGDSGFEALPGPDAADPFAPADPFAAASAGEPFDPAAFRGAPDQADPAPLETVGAAPAPPEPVAAALPAAARAIPAAARAIAAPAPAGMERIPGRRGSRLRAVAANAVALVALLGIALAILVAWRSDGHLEPAALRPSAVVALLRGGASAEGPFAAVDVRSGLYERVRGPPLLFVRGKVVSRAPSPVRAVVVSVEVVRAGAVVARGEAIAGGMPTPEELHGASDAAALAQAAGAARARAPREVRPGDELPFLVAVGDAPADVDGASLRVAVAPRGGELR